MPKQLLPKMSQQEALGAAIALTDEILKILEEGEFERVDELEKRRKILIEQAFEDSIAQVDLIRAQHLQSLNQQVIDKLNLFKEAVILQQKRIRNASRASRAYLSNDSYPK